MHEECPICQAPLAPGQAACERCGFKLSGTTLGFSPVEVPMASAGAAVAPIQDDPHHAPTLRMVRGPQRGAEYKVSPDITSIGRNPQCDIFLNDMTVSRLHASIQHAKDAHVIRDEQSFNGVWVNNVSVDQKVLEHGDFIQIGRFGFVFDAGE